MDYLLLLLHLVLGALQRGQLALYVEHLLDCLLLLVAHVVDPRLHCLTRTLTTWIALSVYLLRSISYRRLMCYKVSA